MNRLPEDFRKFDDSESEVPEGSFASMVGLMRNATPVQQKFHQNCVKIGGALATWGEPLPLDLFVESLCEAYNLNEQEWEEYQIVLEQFDLIELVECSCGGEKCPGKFVVPTAKGILCHVFMVLEGSIKGALEDGPDKKFRWN